MICQRKMRFGAITAVWIAIAAIQALPAFCGDATSKAATREEASLTKRLSLSIRIAEAKNRQGSKKYYQSVARQRKHKRPRKAVTRSQACAVLTIPCGGAAR